MSIRGGYARALAATFFVASVFGCSGQSLDGGNKGDAGGSSGSSGGSGGSDLPDTPLSGTIAGHAFSPLAVDLRFSKAENQWLLHFSDRKGACGVIEGPNRPDTSNELVVNIGKVSPAVGTEPIAYADGHGAAFQIGVFEASDSRKPEVHAASSGVLRLDTWSDAVGTTVHGALRLEAEASGASPASTIAGTFDASVCTPR